ncbi:GNAT family N-acetyltransferase [Mariniflexile soesokkakense]|uniref:GNAT family N-acetyltransferase n=1 Tax=Mariniflexile soesokkakense TaxID=1343160 RepID=A0ABV0AE57_9FLAO
MIKIEEIEILDESFINKIENFASPERFQFYFFFNAVNMVNYGHTSFYDCFILKNGKTTKIIGLFIDFNYYLYGKDWTQEELKIVRDRIDFKSFPNEFHFVGTYELINQLFEKTDIKTNDFKNRIFYKITDKIKPSNTLLILYPTLTDLDELAQLCMEAHREEYKELSVRPLEDFINTARNQISKSSIVINKNGAEITGFCTAMYVESDEPMIGTLYVREKYRNKGIGKSLLNYLTSELMTKAKACYLMTERDNKSANKVMESIGFNNIYEHLDKTITAPKNM